MSFCSVCNGLSNLNAICSKCNQEAKDYGRIGDFMGPYSAYLNIDELKTANGYPDLKNHQCVHLAYCELCDSEFHKIVSETVY
ncbi:hypothetical protein [Chengkuizengella axinellae]|uniref:Uncharacterized protein n=1 Tax=Chengkuizengella axinellae TaxID=3064388 RepID=A0ABT9ITA1_9BACL|nr:hypothetical protein [Chengkuizengella sp. 2205SS18-9]MDP5272576.1 hypothetical protein [Chengkuizengella sp. 2205SS18-9]